MAAVTTFLYLNAMNALKYYNYPTTADVKISYQKELNFPAITLCNYNPNRWVPNENNCCDKVFHIDVIIKTGCLFITMGT